ncbi:MAG: transcriptional regulator [Legionella sp.]|jgi:antitoxin MazE|nr:transcriptional regulator [Legionella sp.]
MKVEAKIQKWGNGLALRVSGALRDIPHFKEGMLVEIDVNEEGFVLKKRVSQKQARFPFDEEQLLKGLTPELAHADLLAKPIAKEVGES